jgi:photosystem II stability/assembly factor-like uncharacterized protein
MMKKISFTKKMILLSFLLVLFYPSVRAQQWTKYLPENKVKTHSLTLKDYQKAFAEYWKEEGQERFLKEEGESQIRDENYEKFKRWEWYWETRVDPVTGAFPKTTAWDIYQEYTEQQPAEILEQANGDWSNIGPNRTGGGYAGLGRVNCVAFSPGDTTTLYVGAAAGGVWKTTNLGLSWKPLGDFNMTLGVADLLVENHGGQDIIYLGTGDKDGWDTYSVGVLKSTDGGQTWDNTGLSWDFTDYAMVYRILKDPDDDNILYVSTNKGLYKTTDGAVSFKRIDAHHFREIEFQPGSNTNMVAGDSWGGIFYSTDAGQSWTQVIDKSSNGGGRVAIAVSADSANVVYGLISDKNKYGLMAVYRSRDYGHTFTVVQDTLNLLGWKCSGEDSGGQGWYDLVLVADPQDANTVYVGGVNNWVSHDGGHHWQLANHWSSTCGNKNDIVHADKHYMAFQPVTNALFECNDGGIYKSNDGKKWHDLTSGMTISQIYRISASATVTYEVLAGLQDNGTKLLSSSSWTDVMGGDGMDCQIDYSDVNTQYGEYSRGDIRRTKDHWQHTKDITDGLTGKGAWVTPFVLDPKNHTSLYVGYQDVFKSTDQGDAWKKLSNWNGATLRSMAVAPSDPNYIYAATYSRIYRSKDGGDTWSDVTNNLPVSEARIKYITVKNDDPKTVWVALGEYNDKGVFKTTNGGDSWINFSTGLPKIPVNCIVQNTAKKDTVELYAGTDIGVFVQQGFSRWIPFDNHLPHVIVNDLDIQSDGNGSGMLFAGTFGRGLWVSPLFKGYIEPIKQALFEADNLHPFVKKDTVTFTDMSTNKPVSWKWVFSPDSVTFVSGTDHTSQNPKVIFNHAGNYTVTLTATDASDQSYTLTQKDYIAAKDILSLTVKANRTSICQGDTTRLFAIVTGGSKNYTYSWGSNPLGFSSDKPNPVVKPFADTVLYYVTVYDGFNYVKDNVTIYRHECTGISRNKALLGKVEVFPNPNGGHFEIRSEKEIYRVEMFNETGSKIYSRVVHAHKATIGRTLAKGVYVLKVTIGTASDVKGFVSRRILVK